MNFAKTRVSLLFLAAAIAASAAFGDGDVEFPGTPPWREGVKYEVVNTYDMFLEGITIDIFTPKKGMWGKIKKDKKGNVIFDKWKMGPFNGYYDCKLNYATSSVKCGKSGRGTAIREFSGSSIEFNAEEGGVFTKEKAGWFEHLFRKDRHKVTKEAIKIRGRKTYFPFSEFYEPESKKMDVGAAYFLAWKKESFGPNSSMDIFKGPKLTEGLSDQARVEIRSGRRRGEWDRCTECDIPYNSIQAEAKLMAYAIYGQSEVRNAGDCWTVDANILTSFLPQLDPRDQPFKFEGGKLVLKVTGVDEDGVQTIEMLPGGLVNGSYVSTDLNIAVNEKSRFNTHFDTPDLSNVSQHSVSFKVDPIFMHCREGYMKLTLNSYCGDTPKMGQMELEGKAGEREFKSPRIEDGRIVIEAKIVTTLSRQ